jgi:hypothetical protein
MTDMKKKALFVVLSLACTGALAAANCPKYPKEEWMKAEDAKARLEAQGYKIRKFKVDGNCYEIYGHTKEGKKAEIYFDAKTLAIVKAEIEK